MKVFKQAGYVLMVIWLASSLHAQTSKATKEKKSPPPEQKVNASGLWLNTVWKSIDDVTTTKKEYDVEKVTTVAGVRGAETEDEATKHLYYRGSMTVPSRAELHEAIRDMEGIIADDPTSEEVPRLKHYIIQCYLQLGDENRAAELSEELRNEYPGSEWTEMYR